ncbi:MAG: BLUF domain-containing protein [Pseudomonadota bacterium]|nr:BLUF domain-containing protein [Pseudomonadota bacterium]
MRQIVYFSTAAERQDAIVIAGILATSRACNRQNAVSGLLVAGGNRYLQVIEGADGAIGTLIANIRRDQRHVGVSVLVDRSVRARSFDGWSMAFREEPALDRFATFRELADQMIDQVPEARLRAQIDCFARIFAVSPVKAAGTPWSLSAA